MNTKRFCGNLYIMLASASAAVIIGVIAWLIINGISVYLAYDEYAVEKAEDIWSVHFWAGQHFGDICTPAILVVIGLIFSHRLIGMCAANNVSAAKRTALQLLFGAVISVGFAVADFILLKDVMYNIVGITGELADSSYLENNLLNIERNFLVWIRQKFIYCALYHFTFFHILQVVIQKTLLLAEVTKKILYLQ